MSVPEALATTMLILLMFYIVLAHQWEPRSMGPPHPPGTPPPGHPRAPMGAHGSPMFPHQRGTCLVVAGTTHRTTNDRKCTKNLFCFKLDAMSVPETLATTIRILLMFSIVLAHQWGRRSWVRPTPSGDASWAPLGPPGHPPALLGTPGCPWERGGGGGVRAPSSATQTIIRLLFQFFPGVQN